VKKIIPILIVVLLAGSASAEFAKVGSAGAQFLKIGVGSKYQAMGEASVAMANDVYSMYWNPAGLAEVENTAVSFTNVNWMLDVQLNYVAIAHYFEDVGVFGVSAAILSMGEQEITTFEEQDGTGDFYSSSSAAVGLTFARQLTNRFSFGISTKYVHERIHKENASGFAFDFGTLLYTGFRSLRLGMSISNMGPELQFSGPDLDINYDERQGQGNNGTYPATLETTPYDLPMMFRVGVAYDFTLAPNSILTMSGEIKDPSDQTQQSALGAQLGFSERFFVRGGYKFNYDEEGLSLGGGLSTPVSKNSALQIDYAWQDFGRLQSTQRFSVGFTF
jgi:hypothetical protein